MAAKYSEVSQLGATLVRPGQSSPLVSQFTLEIVYGPPAAKLAKNTQNFVQIARSGGSTNVAARVSQAAVMFAYKTSAPGLSRQDAWTFIIDGHRFYVMPLGKEGDWAYDTTTKEWTQLQTQGFDGMNFKNGVMWDIRIMGGDSLYPTLLELDPNQPFDDGFRTVPHVVTGGIPARGRYSTGVANFTLTASVDNDASVDQPISLAFSDDNGSTWSTEFTIPLTDIGSQQLIWNGLGSFHAPGRVFRVTDYGGPIRIDGADVVLTPTTGADSGQDNDG